MAMMSGWYYVRRPQPPYATRRERAPMPRERCISFLIYWLNRRITEIDYQMILIHTFHASAISFQMNTVFAIALPELRQRGPPVLVGSHYDSATELLRRRQKKPLQAISQPPCRAAAPSWPFRQPYVASQPLQRAARAATPAARLKAAFSQVERQLH